MPLLTPESYDIFRRLSETWALEDAVIGRIAEESQRRPADVRRRLTLLRQQGLIERRRRHTIDAAFEIRRIGRE